MAAPLQAFSHTSSDAGPAIQAVVVGDVYEGPAFQGLQPGDVVFSSLTTGQIFSISPGDPTRTVHFLATSPATIVDMRQGTDGAFYYADLAGGTIGRLQISATPGAGGGGTATAVGAGPDVLVLRLQEDAYKGDAQYTVGVNGASVGGVLTATATRASGQFDTVTVRGDFGPGPHQAAVTFLNDAWSGSPDADRNLFVAGASFNGAAVALKATALQQSGPAYFVFGDAPATS